MTAYVDDVRHRFGRMTMCHMWADTPDELHALAAAIGVQRRWFQTPPKASWDHYDISLGMKDKAIALGAVLTDKFGPALHVAKLRGDLCMVARIAYSRGLRADPPLSVDQLEALRLAALEAAATRRMFASQ